MRSSWCVQVSFYRCSSSSRLTVACFALLCDTRVTKRIGRTQSASVTTTDLKGTWKPPRRSALWLEHFCAVGRRLYLLASLLRFFLRLTKFMLVLRNGCRISTLFLVPLYTLALTSNFDVWCGKDFQSVVRRTEKALFPRNMNVRLRRLNIPGLLRWQ